MIDAEPPYYGSWKGRVLEAIAVGNIRDWNGILDYTQLYPESLNTAISELYRLDIIERKEDGLYWIKNKDIYYQYRSYFKDLEYYKAPLIEHEEHKEKVLEKALPKDENIANFIVKWRAFKNLSFSLGGFLISYTKIDFICF